MKAMDQETLAVPVNTKHNITSLNPEQLQRVSWATTKQVKYIAVPQNITKKITYCHNFIISDYI
jgi:hypothetical protein